MSLTYSTFVSSYSNLLEYDSSRPEFVALLPNAIDYAEQRIYRELELITQIARDSSGALTQNRR